MNENIEYYLLGIIALLLLLGFLSLDKKTFAEFHNGIFMPLLFTLYAVVVFIGIFVWMGRTFN